jgi:hypothetical protein
LSAVEIDVSKSPKSIKLVKDTGDCEAAWIGLQSDWFMLVEMVNGWWFGKAFLSFRNPSSAPQVHSHFRMPSVICMYDMGADTIAYFRMNLW